ncbi:4-coumarate--CoA ligase-like 7 [Sphaceloma murrayae]|uniref:4-coumarate--CoA ligase-like 7 n=1 Tax=Sphaceloma murrayae TaxID=2082308 RepID=A0A2K1QRY0_9PEZI|nr:4-coumarate--CoA ligase-like 7 [Sphaceloma murrayae]
MALNPSYISLARRLPAPLLSFFARHPPGTFITSQHAEPSTIASLVPSTVPLPSLTTLSASPEHSTTTNPTPSSEQLSALTTLHKISNPFLAWQNPVTSAWRPPQYSLRQQNELYKMAKQNNVLSLLPESPRHPEMQKQRDEQGLRVKGTGQGQRVKGREWERQLRGRQEKRKRAMEGMAELIKEWKQRGHGRGWKKWPK